MKRILLRSLPDSRFQLGTPEFEANRVDYRSTIEQVIRVPLNRQTGATIDEMRKGIRVLDALDRAQNNLLELEDADWQHLKEKVEAMPWAMVDRRFIVFHDDVLNATDAPRSPVEPLDGVASAKEMAV
jgi:hypothetical protein